MGTRKFQDTGGNALRKVRHEALRRVLSILLTVAMTIEGMPPAAVAWALDDITSGEASSTVVLGADETEGLEEGSATVVGEDGGGTAGVSDVAIESQAAPEPDPEPEPEHVAIVFDANVAEGDEHPAQGEMQPFDFVMDGEVHELTANAYAREGYTFEGWSLTPDGRDVKDDPKTEADESFKTLAIPDRLAMANLGYDEAVEDTDASGEVVSYHMVARNLEYAVHDGRITLYAQWAKVEEPKPEAQATQEEPADVKEDGAGADDVAVVEAEADETKADETKADETKADETKADETKADETKADDVKSEEVTTDDEHGAEVEHEDVAAESEGDVSVSAVVSDDGPEAVLVEGELSGDDAVADALMDDAGVGGAKARTMAKRLSAPLKMPVPAEDENVPRQLDGSFIENISVSWVTEDTVDNGDDALLYVKPEGDIPFRVRAILDYALSGEHDYEAGDVTITVPAKMFYNRDGSDAQTWVYPYAAEPSKSGDFMWSRVGDTIVFTNTHRLQAATKGYIEFDMSNLVPHKIVDMSTTEPFWARIEVATHLGNVIGLSSSEIEAQVDTEEQLTDAYKYTYDAPSIVRASDVPEAARVPGEENYVVVPWTMYGYVEGNTEFTLEIEDHKTDEYQGTIMYPSVTDRYQDSLFTGYKAGNDDGTQGAVLGTKKVQVVYPLSQFEPDVTYTFKNQVTYTLTEVDPAVGDDPQLVTQKVAAATRDWSWHLPTFRDPKGHFMVQKYGNDGQNGRKPYYSHYVYNRAYKYYDCDIWNHSSPYFGSYPSGLNDLRDGKSVELGYTLDSTGYLLPWTLEGDPRVASNYNKRSVTMVTTDMDETDARSVWFEGLDLELGRDYVYKAFEFPQMPRIYCARAVNLNPDGSFAALTAGDGTVDYQFDRDASHVPDITLEAKVSGVWQQIAVASWKTGDLVITPISSVIVDGSRVSLPAGTEQVRTSLTTNIAAVEYHVRPIIELKPSEAVMGVVEELFDGNSTPSGEVYNTTYMKAYDSDGNEIVDIHKKAYDELGGYSVDVAVQPTKTYRQVTVDPDRREVRVHYSASVYERSYIPEVSLWEEAVADGYLVPDTAGVFYDLLPLGMTPVLSSVRLRSDDRVVDAYKVENWRNTGRTMLIVEASLSPQPEEYDDDGHIRIEDALRLNFDAVYPFESVVDYGKDVHNVIAYESFVREPLGTVDGLGAEADDPTTRNNVTTPQAFKTDDEISAMTGLDDSREGERFVYAGVTGTIDMPSAARTSLSKDIQVNNDGRWSQGTYEDKRTVYEGGVYSYRLRMMSDNNTISRDLVMYDSLENFYAAQGNDEVDIDAPRWRGELVGVDTLQLRMMGCAPVVYYSTVDELQLADESNPDAANDTNTNLDDRNIWVKASDYTGDLADVHAVAIDCRKRTDGTPFELTPLESATALIRMHAPHGEPAREYIAEDAHAYNNIYLKCTSVDKTTGIANGKNFVRHDYTKVGLEEFKIEATKVWDDDSDRDGVRPDELTFQLIANGTDVVQTATATAPDWKATFENMPYTDENGQTIRYRVDEVVPEGYARSVSSDGNSFTITNKHVPETVHLTGTKTWVGGEDAIPASITVRLYADGNLVATKQVKPAEDGSWSYDFGEMPKYRDQGTEIVYTVDETKVPAAWVPTYSETSLDIENTYHPFGDLVVTKNVVGATEAFSDRRFDVTVDLMGADGEALTDEFAYDTSDGRTGMFMSGGSISLASGESATIHELPENTRYVVTESAPAGYTMSGKDLVGYATANTDTTAAVTNTYLAKGFVNLEAKKQLTGRELRRYQFRFELLDENGELLRTASNKADGSVVFGAINYTQADVGEHRYQVVETVRDKAGYTYDERVYTAIVTVGDLGNGTLSVETRYENAEGEPVDVPFFENTYKAEGSVKLKAWKKLEGRALTDGEFSFELLDEEGQRVGNAVTNNATGEVVFDEIKFDQDDAGKTYKYIAREVPGSDETVVYSTETYGYEVSVVDNGDGTLSFAYDTTNVVGRNAALTFADVGADAAMDYDWVSLDSRGSLYFYLPNVNVRGLVTSPQSAAAETLNGLFGEAVFSSEDFVDISTTDRGGIISKAVSLLYASRPKLTAWISAHDEYFGGSGVVSNGWIIIYGNTLTQSYLAEQLSSMAHTAALDTVGMRYDVVGDEDVTPVFTNTLKPGVLRIEKHVGNVNAEHRGDQFRFKVKLTGDGVLDMGELAYEHEMIEAPVAAITPNSAFGAVCDFWDMLCGLVSPRVAYAAEDDIASGKIGTGPTGGIDWRVTSAGELIIGDGTQTQVFYPSFSNTIPTDVKAQVTSARIDGTIKVVGYAAQDMFANFPHVKVIDVTGLDTSEAVSLYDMFYLCRELEEIRGLDTLDTSSNRNFSNMFDHCESLPSLDLRTFDVSNATATNNMLRGLYSCDTLDVSGWHFSDETSVRITLLEGGSNFKTVNARGWYIPSSRFAYAARLFGGDGSDGYDLDVTGWTFGDSSNMSEVFHDCGARSIKGLDTWDTSTTENMSGMFRSMENILALDLSSFDTSNVKNISTMFSDCASLKQLVIDGWNLDQINGNYGNWIAYLINLDRLSARNVSLKTEAQNFFGCGDPGYSMGRNSKYTVLDVTGLNLNGIQNLAYLFRNQKYLDEIVGLNTIDVSNATIMAYMFSGDADIKHLDLRGWDTSNVYVMENMFSSMTALEDVDMSTFDTSKVQTFDAMFNNDTSLTELDVSNFDMSSAATVSRMFAYATSLATIYASSDADWSRQMANPNSYSPFTSNSALVGGEGTPFGEVTNSSAYFARVDGLVAPDGGDTRGLFTAGVYSVSFDANGGSGSMAQQHRLADNAFDIPVSRFRRFGYVQSGWEDQNGNTYELGGTIPANTFGDGDRVVLKAVWVDEDATVSMEDGEFYVTLGVNEAATFDGLPAGVAYSVFEETSEGWVLVSQSNTSGNIMPAETSVAEFTNRYDEASTSIALGGTKTLDGRGAAEGAFTFELREDGQLIESVTNAAGGGISFSPIVYGEGDVGTHVYTIEEVSGNDSTIIYDTHTETVVVEVSLNGRNLSAVPTYDADGANFANTTLPGSIEISKETDGGGDPDQEFEFEVELKGVMGAVGTGDDGGSVLEWLVDGVRLLFSVRKAYAATGWSQWTQYGSSVEWRIDESGMLCIRPIEGNRGVLKWTPDGSNGYYPPWHNDYTSLHRQIRGLSIPAGKTIECQGSLYSMFGDSGVVTVDTRGLDTSKATSMDYMFVRCESLVAVPRLDYDNVQSAKDMFENCNSLTDVDMHGIEFPELVNAEYMFAFCDNLRSVNWSGVSAPKLERMRYLFNQAGKLSSFDMSDSSFPSVEDVDYMLQNSGNDAGSDVYFNFSGVTWGPSMAHMIYIGQSKCHIDFTGADLTRVVNATGAFGYLSNGVEFKMPNVSMPNLTDAGYMVVSFGSSQNSEDVNIDIHGCDFGHADIRGLLSYAGIGYAGGYTNAGVLNCAGISISDCTVDNSMFSDCTFSLIDLSGVDLTNFSGNWLEGTGNRDGDTLLDIHDSKLPENCYKFLKSNYITDIDMHDADTSSVTSMSYMFGNSRRLKSVNLSGIDTSHVTNMGNMFSGDRLLVELDLTGFDVSSLTEMWAMFQDCFSLETIYAKADADWPIDSTVDDERVFEGCTSLIGGDGTEFDQNVIGFEMARVDGLDGEPGYFTNGTGDTVVSFGANGGSIVVGESHVVMRNRVTDVSVPKVMRDGYVFVGWNTKADGTGVDYGTPNKVTPTQGRSMTLYAQWAPEGEAYSYKVVHRLEKADEPGSFEVTGRETRHAGSLNDVTVTPNSYYGFVKPAAQTVDIAEDGSTEVTFDYMRARITVTYVLDDGTTRTQTMMGGVRTPLDAAPVVAGKRFVGWLDGEHGENGFYADGQAVSLGADTTLYAHYVDEGAEDDYEGTSRVMHVRVKAGETVTIPNIPAGTVYEVREVNVPSGWEQVSIKGGTGTVGANSISVVSARNAYSSSGKFDIVAHKSLVGGELTEGAFSFELLDGNGRVIARSVNGGVDTAETIADAISGEAIANPNFGLGVVNFRDIQVSEPGTYTYTVREVAGRDADIVYDEHVETVTVVATDRGDGTIACDVTYDADGATFTNRVNPPEERTYEGLNGNLSVTKEVAQGPDGKTFTFDVEARDENGAPLNASFETRAYTGGTAMYTRNGVWHTGNITNSGTKLGDVASSVWEYGTVSVPGAESIHLEFDYTNPRGSFYIWAGDHTEQVAARRYDSEFSPNTADVNIPYINGQNKENILLHGSADINGDIATIAYQCYAYPQNNCPPDNGGYNEWTNYGCFVRATGEVEDDAYDQGSITFVDGHATLEVVGGQKKDIVGLPAGATYRVTEQEMDGWQQISAEGTEGTILEDVTAEVRFTNSYFPEGSFEVRAKKVGVGLDITDGAYEFVMGGPNDEFVGRVRNDADGNVVFSDLAIEPEWAGTTRTYTISEIPGEDEGILWDTHAEEVKVSFADDGEGHLTANVAYDADGCVFTNERLIPMPGTGLGGIPFRMLGYGFAAVAIALSTIVVRRRRREDGTV